MTHEEALHAASDACPMSYFTKLVTRAEGAQYLRCGASSLDFETMLLAYLEARGAVLCHAFPAGMITERKDNYIVVPIWINGYPPVGSVIHADFQDSPPIIRVEGETQ